MVYRLKTSVFVEKVMDGECKTTLLTSLMVSSARYSFLKQYFILACRWLKINKSIYEEKEIRHLLLYNISFLGHLFVKLLDYYAMVIAF